MEKPTPCARQSCFKNWATRNLKWRAALEALKKQHPDAEKHSNGYRQLEIHARKGIREVEETLVVAPTEYKPPLEIVRRDLAAMEEELIKLLFPRRPADKKATAPATEKRP